MNYMSAKEAAELWGISQRRVATLCSEQRIPNVKIFGNMWIIPKDAKKPIDGRSIRHMKEKRMKPFVKWAGGKGQLIDEIRKQYPKGLGDTIRKYAEPFVGGGAVLFDILNEYELDEIYISDINAELISTYQVLRDNADALISRLSQYQDEYLPLSDDFRKEYYYEKRKKFNELKCQDFLNTEIASLFIFLNRTCFNGLYRVNSKGEYNVPIGSYKSPLICDVDNLRQVSKALSGVSIVCGDYRKSNDFIDNNTFVYFDPPYRPLNATSSFTAYTENMFDDKAQSELAEYIQQVSDKGAYVVASNSDPKNINPDDDFFDELYSKMKIMRISASRMINSNAGSRGKISELLICSY
ncbi:MAG: Dam family site-specific DNA-(adenine-N6)-methyltransferase [Clostridiaceae bacterium]|nr:Dam family site-specific DNA-(adenine-N6)-methyltransferase [Clostridiaceae bacterium]